MNPLRLIDDSLLDKYSDFSNYNLSIFFNRHKYLSFSVIRKRDDRFLAFCKYPLSKYKGNNFKKYISEIFSNDSLLSNSFNSVNFNFISSFNTLIPIMFFDRKKKENYASIFIKKLERIKDEKIGYDFVNPLDVVNLYSYFPQINDIVADKYSSVAIRHNVTFFLMNCYQYHNDNKEKILYVNVNKNYFEAVVIDHEKLFFCNSFHYKAHRDFIYYILLIFESLKLDTRKNVIVLFGDMRRNSPLFKLLSDYIKNIKFSKEFKNIKLSKKLKELDKSKLFYLLNK